MAEVTSARSARPRPRRGAFGRWWPFVLLCAVASTQWTLSETMPSAAPTLLSGAGGCVLAACVALGLRWARWGQRVRSQQGLPEPVPPKPHRRSVLRYALGGALLFAGPAIGLLCQARTLSAESLELALALTPVALVLAESALGSAEGALLPGRVWPGLASVTGLLLLFPEPALGDLRTDVALILAPLVSAVGAALLGTAGRYGAAVSENVGSLAVRTWGAASETVPALLGGATVLGVGAVVGELSAGSGLPAFSLAAALLEACLAGLTLLTLGRLGAARWSARFSLVPLLLLLEGVALTRPSLTARDVAGLALLLVATLFLLSPPREAEEPTSLLAG